MELSLCWHSSTSNRSKTCSRFRVTSRYPMSRYPMSRCPTSSRYPMSRYPVPRYPVPRYPVTWSVHRMLLRIAGAQHATALRRRSMESACSSP
eukprot:2603521-Rhodomonas_salina.1